MSENMSMDTKIILNEEEAERNKRKNPDEDEEVPSAKKHIVESIFNSENLNDNKRNSHNTDLDVAEKNENSEPNIEEKTIEENVECKNSSFTEESSDEDDNMLMHRALQSVLPSKQEVSDELIALEDTDEESNEIADEEEQEEEDESEDDDEDVNEKDEEEDEEQNMRKRYFEEYDKIAKETSKRCLRKRILRYNPRFYLSRLIVKRSIKFLLNIKSTQKIETVSIENDKIQNCNEETFTKTVEHNVPDESVEEKISTFSNLEEDKSCDKNNIDHPDNTESSASLLNENNAQSNLSNQNVTKESSNEKANFDAEVILENNQNNSEKELKTDCFDEHPNEFDCNNLLKEISQSSVDDIINRYITRIDDQSSSYPTYDDISDELFFCLQQNKKDIQRIQHLWNEKVHLKYKIREIIERIRRHRAVIEIEAFGYKPGAEKTECNSNVISSKSSTTNSENENYEKLSRMSTESISKLIQDVRTNVLRKDENNKLEESLLSIPISLADSFHNEINVSTHLQGRQGQTIDVQSIINDFRQKHPQEIPRRGRRFKNNFNDRFMMEDRHQEPNKDNLMNYRSNQFDISNEKNSFPEVSLLPVKNFYKNITNSQYEQKSSLLQSILTKKPTKSLTRAQHLSAGSTSTLAKLLTTPERCLTNRSSSTVRNSTKVHHNNGEITITPIVGPPKKEFLMDDGENSEPMLVIDEQEDQELSNQRAELLCQGCKSSKALFMCAGCSRQWYCSKECQELAWDDHAESCLV